MSTSPASSSAFALRAVPAWVVFGATLLSEYLLVSFLVDAQDILAPADLEAQSLGDVVPLLFLFVAAVFLTGGSAVRLRLRTLSAYRTESSHMIAFGIAHFALFSATVAFSLWFKSIPEIDRTLARASVSLWFLLALLSSSALVFTLWSRVLVLETLRGLYRELTIGLLVGLLAWGSGMVARSLWKPLAWLTLELVHAILTVIAADPVASIEHALVGTSRFYVNVAPVCSGIEGVGLMLTFVGAYLYVERRELHWPRSLLLLPISALGVWLLNVVRIAALISVGTWFSPQVALGGFHSKAGWVFFTLSALGVVFWVRRGQLFRRAVSSSETTSPALRGQSAREEAPQPLSTHSDLQTATLAYLAPLLAILATKMLTGLTASGFDHLYPLSVIVALAALFHFRKHYPHQDWSSPGLPLGLGVAVGVLWIVGFSEDSAASQLSEGLASLPPTVSTLWLIARTFGAVVTVPIAEELAFRGFLLRRFVAADFASVSYQKWSWLGLIVSSVTFGALHSQWELGIAAGFAFGSVTIARGRLSDAVVAHAAANALIVAYVFVTGKWALLG